jgi:DNA-binding LacI/PurR family transcriptional regulator/DNA-binding transcriptional regulator YhcF (GntR family)
MIDPIRREFLRDAAARQLREALAEGLWKEYLPSEAALCQKLHVSRRTIRSALAQLVREKWLRSRGRGLTLAILPPVRRRSRARAAKVIRYLSPRRAEMNDHSTQVEENALREHVGRAGFRLEFECHPNLYDRFSAKRMKDLAFQPDTAAWVLLNATREIQEWFVSSGLPCVVTGACHEGVDLPNVEFDYAANCFHAVHLLAGQGQGHVVYVTQALLNASDQSAVRGFLEAANRFPHLKATVTRHDDAREGICQALQSLLRVSPKPTGYLVSLAEHTLTTLGFLQSQGVRVPADASVICCIDSPFLDFHIPSVAQYRIDCVKSGHTLGALAVDVIRHGAGRSRHVKIVPEFVPGQTFVSAAKQTLAS